MRKFIFLAVSCLLMTSCVIDKREMVSAENNYDKEFEKAFGQTDPNHTWKMVDNRAIEVNLDKPSRVKIYVKVGKSYKLVADYENVSGKQQLSFDAPMGCEDVYVTVDGVPYQQGSRTSIIPGGNTVISVGGNYRVYTYSQIEGFKADEETLPERVDNINKVTLDYRAMAEENTTYTFYPLFWNAYFSHTFGLYYYVGNEKYEIDFYKDKEGDCLQLYNQTTSAWENVTADYVFEKIFSQDFAGTDQVLRSKPYSIKFPDGTSEFGFYVIVYEPKEGQGLVERAKYYSNPALNGANSISSFAYLEVGGNTYITIEDHNHDDFDYNDFIFVMEGTQEHITEDPTEYIYAVEDLGSTDDFDFNDVVFSVSYVSGQPHANVKPLAAGGTLPADICFGSTSYGEVHGKFGVDTKVMVNTADGTTKESLMQADPFPVQVGKRWSHTASDNSFNVKVKKDGNIIVVTTPVPGQNAAPQILVLAEDWLWPTERTRINAAYTTFGQWCENYIDNTWINSPVMDYVVDWIN